MRALSLLLLLVSASAAADVVKLRFATVGPDGTAWAREMRALSRDVAAQTNGAVEIKWYFGGIAGDEEQSLQRIRAGQLEGIGAAIVCTRLAPSLRVLRIPGLFGGWAEGLYVLGLLRPRIAAEFEKSGLVSLGEGGFGNDIIFSRAPVTSLADLQQGRFAYWDLDDVYRAALPLAGIHGVPIKPETGSGRLERGEIDGIITPSSPALAFQFSTVAHYYSELALGFLPACIVVSRSAFDGLSAGQQQILRAAGAKFQARINDLGQEQDRRLLGGLFEHQGLKRLVPSESFRGQFFAAAKRAREELPESLVPRALLNDVLRWLADYRAEHPIK